MSAHGASRYWRDDAVCCNHPSLPPQAWDLHWHDSPRKPTQWQKDLNQQARKVCDECPVRRECATAAPKEDAIGVTIRWIYFPKDVKYAAAQRKAATPTRPTRHARPDDDR